MDIIRSPHVDAFFGKNIAKGLDFFLQAAKKVVNIFPDSKFIIVGEHFLKRTEFTKVN